MTEDPCLFTPDLVDDTTADLRKIYLQPNHRHFRQPPAGKKKKRERRKETKNNAKRGRNLDAERGTREQSAAARSHGCTMIDWNVNEIKRRISRREIHRALFCHVLPRVRSEVIKIRGGESHAVAAASRGRRRQWWLWTRSRRCRVVASLRAPRGHGTLIMRTDADWHQTRIYSRPPRSLFDFTGTGVNAKFVNRFFLPPSTTADSLLRIKSARVASWIHFRVPSRIKILTHPHKNHFDAVVTCTRTDIQTANVASPFRQPSCSIDLPSANPFTFRFELS